MEAKLGGRGKLAAIFKERINRRLSEREREFVNLTRVCSRKGGGTPPYIVKKPSRQRGRGRKGNVDPELTLQVAEKNLKRSRQV